MLGNDVSFAALSPQAMRFHTYRNLVPICLLQYVLNLANVHETGIVV